MGFGPHRDGPAGAPLGDTVISGYGVLLVGCSPSASSGGSSLFPTLPRSENVLDTYFVKDRKGRKRGREERRKEGRSKDQSCCELPGDANTSQGGCRGLTKLVSSQLLLEPPSPSTFLYPNEGGELLAKSPHKASLLALPPWPH